MSTLQVTFPERWAVLRRGPDGRVTAEELVAGMAELGEDTQDAARAYFDALIPALDQAGIEALASLVVRTPEPPTTVQAHCALAVLSRDGSGEDDLLRAVAEGGPHPGLERETWEVELPAGPAVRSFAFRHATELVDADGVAPYAAEVRFAFPVHGDRVGVLHFETLSLVYLDQLTEMFDAIAGTTRIGEPA
jgi:hypothetical protein